VVASSLGASQSRDADGQTSTEFGLYSPQFGLTVVAFGTSAPELAVSLQATLGGRPDIALGNVVGSNIANILLILGIAGLIAPLVVTRQIIRVDVPIMIAASILLLWMARNGVISTLEGGVLAAGLVAYLALQFRLGRSGGDAGTGEIEPVRGGWPLAVGMVAVGLVLLVLGSRWLVEGAVAIATAMGVSQLVIGLTVVAVGTSLPEIATSLFASWYGASDIVVGNIIGSETAQITLAVGIVALIAPIAASRDNVFRYGGAMLVAMIIMILTMEDGVIIRSEGFLMAFSYAFFVYHIYTTDGGEEVVEHVEAWNVSGLEAIGQILRPSKVKT